MARSNATPAKPVLFLLGEFAAPGRLDPAEWLSKTLGETTVEHATMQHGSSSTGRFTGSRTQGTARQFTGRSLFTPDKVMQLPQGEQILLVEGIPPVAARKLRYFEDREFKGLFDLQTQQCFAG